MGKVYGGRGVGCSWFKGVARSWVGKWRLDENMGGQEGWETDLADGRAWWTQRAGTDG